MRDRPSVRNALAIRAYEKIGLKPLRDVFVADEPDAEHLMRVSRRDLAAPSDGRPLRRSREE
jgi:hypothetical protein